MSRAQIDDADDFIPSNDLIATYATIEDFVAAGWTIDVYYLGLGEEELYPKGGSSPSSNAPDSVSGELNVPSSFGAVPF